MRFIEVVVLFPMAGFALIVLAAMVLHELGHLVTAWFLGVKVHRVGICWSGLYIVREAGSAQENIKISMAGPLVNILLIACWHVSPFFAVANFFCAFCNLLPAPGTDGHRIMTLVQGMIVARTAPRMRPPIAEMERRPVVMMPSESCEATMNPAA